VVAERKKLRRGRAFFRFWAVSLYRLFCGAARRNLSHEGAIASRGQNSRPAGSLEPKRIFGNNAAKRESEAIRLKPEPVAATGRKP
jgi:hypothetical protein